MLCFERYRTQKIVGTTNDETPLSEADDQTAVVSIDGDVKDN